MAARRSLYMTGGTAALAGSALIALAPLALRDRLPDRFATHWTGAGVPDDHLPFTVWTLMCVGLWLVFCGSAVVVGLSGWGRRTVRGLTGATLGFGAGLTAGMIATTLGANLDRASYRQAGEVGPGSFLLVLLGSAVVALIGWLIGRTGPDEPREAPPGEEPRLRGRMRAGQRPVWVGYVSNRPVLLFGGTLVVRRDARGGRRARRPADRRTPRAAHPGQAPGLLHARDVRHRPGGSGAVLSVDDAERGAALLNSLRDRTPGA